MKLAPLTVLSEDDIRQIHQASVEILQRVGVKICHPRLLDLLASRGLPVDWVQGIVRIPQACLDDALAHIPPRFMVFDREGEPAFLLVMASRT